MQYNTTFTGIILAGGKSSRLGRDKGLVEWQGRKIVEFVIEVLSPFCAEVLISSNNLEYKQFSHRVVPDILPGNGPMMGLYSALRSSSTNMNLVLAVDNILVTDAFYRYLLSKDLTGSWIAVPLIGDRFYEPLVGFYKTDCIQVMESFMKKGNYKLPDLISDVPSLKLTVETDFPDYHPNYFQSLNRPEDLVLLDDLPPATL